MLLFFLLMCDVLITYRIGLARRPAAASDDAAKGAGHAGD